MPVADIFPTTVTPYISLMIGGFFVGMVGHLYNSKTVVAFGIMMIFAATLLLPLALIVSEDRPAAPSEREILAPGSR
ncbi:MAG: hypothetical protein M3O25_05285 [Actinomycetota bacterium]|nr:hypothetical protein [Actinomycetota bacterium]